MKSDSRQRAGSLTAAGVYFLLTLALWGLFRILPGAPVGQRAAAAGRRAGGDGRQDLPLYPPGDLPAARRGECFRWDAGTVFGFDKTGLLWGAGLAVFFLLYYGCRSLLLDGSVGFTAASLNAEEIISTVLFAGLTEEIFSRGYLLNRLWKRFPFWLANTLAGLAFLAAHFPIWYTKGYFAGAAVLKSCLSTFVIGLLLGYVARRSGGSVWGAVFAHSMHNLIVITLV